MDIYKNDYLIDTELSLPLLTRQLFASAFIAATNLWMNIGQQELACRSEKDIELIFK